jgi:hypothetical protein
VLVTPPVAKTDALVADLMQLLPRNPLVEKGRSRAALRVGLAKAEKAEQCQDDNNYDDDPEDRHSVPLSVY